MVPAEEASSVTGPAGLTELAMLGIDGGGIPGGLGGGGCGANPGGNGGIGGSDGMSGGGCGDPGGDFGDGGGFGGDGGSSSICSVVASHGYPSR